MLMIKGVRCMPCIRNCPDPVLANPRTPIIGGQIHVRQKNTGMFCLIEVDQHTVGGQVI